MIEFYTFSWAARILITVILGLCVLIQTLALVLNLYRCSLILTTPPAFENLFELSILCEILVFSLLHGQVINGYKNGLILPTGYENIRIFVFLLVLILAIVLWIRTRMRYSLSVIPAVVISLPIVENALGHAFPW